MIVDFSEPGGYFRSDNFVSNEMAFQYVIPALQATTKPGGIYLGVGPDQNFTYIVGIKPKLSFIFDIRRGNLEEQLLYKAIVELSDNRADFLSRLFSRPRPLGLDTASSADAMLNAYEGVRTNDTLYQKNLKDVRDWLTKTSLASALGDFRSRGESSTSIRRSTRRGRSSPTCSETRGADSAGTGAACRHTRS